MLTHTDLNIVVAVFATSAYNAHTLVGEGLDPPEKPTELRLAAIGRVKTRPYICLSFGTSPCGGIWNAPLHMHPVGADSISARCSVHPITNEQWTMDNGQ